MKNQRWEKRFRLSAFKRKAKGVGGGDGEKADRFQNAPFELILT